MRHHENMSGLCVECVLLCVRLLSVCIVERPVGLFNVFGHETSSFG